MEAQQRRALASLSAEQRGVFDRLVGEWDLPPLDAVQLAAEERLSEFFHATVAAHPGNARGVANWILNEALPVLRDGEGGQLEPAALAELVKLQDEGVVSSAGAREAFAVLVEQGGDPRAIVAERGLEQVSDTAALEGIIDGLLGAHPAQVEAYRAGKTGLAGFFVGQVMKETRGRANPRLVKELVERKLG